MDLEGSVLIEAPGFFRYSICRSRQLLIDPPCTKFVLLFALLHTLEERASGISASSDWPESRCLTVCLSTQEPTSTSSWVVACVSVFGGQPWRDGGFVEVRRRWSWRLCRVTRRWSRRSAGQAYEGGTGATEKCGHFASAGPLCTAEELLFTHTGGM